MATEYRDTKKVWKHCKMCKEDFRNSDGKFDTDSNGKPLCPSCSDTYWNGCGGF